MVTCLTDSLLYLFDFNLLALVWLKKVMVKTPAFYFFEFQLLGSIWQGGSCKGFPLAMGVH